MHRIIPALVVTAILSIVAGIGFFIHQWATSEILLEHGVVVEKRFKPDHHGVAVVPYIDSDGNVHTRVQPTYTPPEYWVIIVGNAKTFSLNDSNAYARFREGDKVKVTYLSKVGFVKRIYREDEEIPVEK